MEIHTEFVTVNVADGTSMRLYVARPTGARPARGLLVMQEAFGINAHIRDVTERFAREGFLAVAPELFHRTGAGFEGKYDDFPSAMAHMKELRDPSMEADFRAAYDWLRGNGIAGSSPIAAIGFCMGGRAAVLACDHAAAGMRRLVLWRRHRSKSDESGIARPGKGCEGAGAAFLGRARRAYYAGSDTRRGGGLQGGRKELCQC